VAINVAGSEAGRQFDGHGQLDQGEGCCAVDCNRLPQFKAWGKAAGGLACAFCSAFREYGRRIGNCSMNDDTGADPIGFEVRLPPTSDYAFNPCS
jgi:hypothetical protein